MSGLIHLMFELPPERRTIEILLPSSSTSPRLIVSRTAGNSFCFQIRSSKIFSKSLASNRSETHGETSESGRCGISTRQAVDEDRSASSRQLEMPEQMTIFACSTQRSSRRKFRTKLAWSDL